MKSRKYRQSKRQRYEAAGAMVLGRARTRPAPASLPAQWYRLRNSLLLVLALVAVGALWLALDERFYVYHAGVQGAVRSSPDEVFRASGLPGLHILWVRPAEVEARILAALPDLASARVACHLPARCKIAVVERQPQLMWDENGQVWWIDAEGVIFSPSPSLSPSGGDASSLPSAGGEVSFLPPAGGEVSFLPPAGGDGGGALLVRGSLPRQEDGRLDERVRVALAELWAAGADVTSTLTYVPGRGLVYTDERGWRVILGQGPGMNKRLQVLQWLAADLQARGVTPRFVDVRFPDAPYYSLINDW